MTLISLNRSSTGRDACTPGNLECEGLRLCTLEPQGIDLAVKPHSIPAGTYRIALLRSPHFGFVTPHLIDVPGFEAVEIHPGNTCRDTHGCILVGEEAESQRIDDSRKAFDALMDILRDSSDVTITIVDPI